MSNFNDLKLGKKYKFILYKIADDKSAIEVEMKKTSSECQSHADFTKHLPANDCRFAVYDFGFSLGEAGNRNKICFVSWSPDTSSVKSKMLYAASKDAFKKRLEGLATEIQATDSSEADEQAFLERLSLIK